MIGFYLLASALFIMMAATLMKVIDHSLKESAKQWAIRTETERRQRQLDKERIEAAWRAIYEHKYRQHLAAQKEAAVPMWARILGVSETSSPTEIKAAFHHKAKKCHPDMGGSNSAMSTLNRAFKEAMDYKKVSR